jgi:hypothetical protein
MSKTALILLLIITFNSFANDSNFMDQHRVQNEALGILDACEKKSANENSSLLTSLTSSDRDIYAGVKQNFAVCEQTHFKSNEVEINNLADFTKNIEKEVAPITILEDLNKSALKQTLRALLFAQLEYTGKVNSMMALDKVSKDYPSISKNPGMLSIFQTEISNFKKISIPEQKSLNKKIINQMTKFSRDLKSLCSEIRKDYESREKTDELQKQGFHYSKNDRVTPILVEDTKKTDIYHEENQQKVLNIIDKFKLNNHHSQLFATSSMKENFKLNSDMGEQCAKGIIKNIFNPPTPGTLLDSQREYLYLLKNELKKRDSEVHLVNKGKKDQPCDFSLLTVRYSGTSACEKVKTKVLVEKKIKETLKYRPHLIGQLLEDNKDSPWYQSIIAKYTCKYSNEIYHNSDELWNAAELAIAGVTIIGAIAAAPAIGLVTAGAGLYTLGALAIGTEGYITINRINDASETRRGIQSGLINNQVRANYQISEKERADSNENWAYFDAAMIGTGTGSIAGLVVRKNKDNIIGSVLAIKKRGLINKLEEVPKVKIKKEYTDTLSEDLDHWDKLKHTIKDLRLLKANNVLRSKYAKRQNNEIIQDLATLLEKKGVRTEIYSSNGFSNLRFLSTEKHAPRELKLYLKALKKFDGNELTYSIFDNIDGGTLGFFVEESKRVEIGQDAMTSILWNGVSQTPRHELRHLLNLKRSRDGENNLFDGSFHAAKGKTLYDDRPLGHYKKYMSVDELYTFADDLWQMSKGSYIKGDNFNQIYSDLKTLSQISGNTTHLADDFLKALNKNQNVTANSDGTFSILNQQGHTYKVIISNTKMLEISALSKTQDSLDVLNAEKMLTKSELKHLDSEQKITDHYNLLTSKSISSTLSPIEKNQLKTLHDLKSESMKQISTSGKIILKKEKLIRREIKERLINLMNFSGNQNIQVQKILKVYNKRIDDVEDGVATQTDLEFTKKLQTELKNLGQNTRWLYSKGKP